MILKSENYQGDNLMKKDHCYKIVTGLLLFFTGFVF